MTFKHRHISPLSLLLLPLLLFIIDVTRSQCVPEQNCKLPDCRCWDDPSIPGGLTKEETPQIVLISFSYAVSGANMALYASAFDDILNPNDCPAKGTFFVQKSNSDFGVIKALYDQKHEIGVTTVDGTTPSNGQEWLDAFKDVKVALEVAGIPPNSILGSRAPELFVGGDDQFDAIEGNQLSYDSSCVSQVYVTPENLLWPYTYDFVDDTPVCNSGKDPEKPYKGKWQFLVADLKFGVTKCATPSSCSPLLNSTQDAFDMLFNAFADHYEGERSPYVLYIDPLWLTVDIQREATRQFLQFIRAGFDDTWIITNQQALDWIKDPVSSKDANDFGPWKC